jgi:hypothetical protein
VSNAIGWTVFRKLAARGSTLYNRRSCKYQEKKNGDEENDSLC